MADFEISPSTIEPNIVSLDTATNQGQTNIVASGGGSVVNGSTSSPNYIPKTAGWTINEDGSAEFRRVNIGGEIINLSAGSDLAAAISDLNAGDGGLINLGIGTFTMSSSTISFTKPISIVGVSPSQTIVDFNNTAGKFSFQGSNVYSTGTITSITSGTAVVGSGTSWLANVTPYVSNLFINGAWYLIGAVSDDTHLTLLENYGGPTVGAGTAYVTAIPLTDMRIENLTIKNSTGSALDFDYVRFVTLSNLLLQANAIGVDANYFAEFARDRITSVGNSSHGSSYTNGGRSSGIYDNSLSNGGNGFYIEAVRTFNLSNTASDGNTADGFHIKSSNDVQLLSVEANGNGGQGIECEATCDNIVITSPIVKGNASDGIKLTATTDSSQIIGGNISSNGGYGINIAASSCDNNTILAPYFTSNTSGDVNDSGTGTIRIQQGDSLSPFGSGVDGAATISADTTLSSDKYYTNLTIDSTKNLTTAGYVIYVSGTLTNNGTIRNNGGNGTAGSVGGTAGTGGAAGSAGAAASGATLDAGSTGQAGSAGSTGTTSASSAGTSVNPSLGSSGVQGGKGGVGVSGATGTVGSAGVATAESLNAIFGVSPTTFTAGSTTNSSGQLSFSGSSSGLSLSSSAGSSGGTGGSGDNGTQTGGGGGGSGASGGNIAIIAKTIVNTGTIQTNGGNGGSGGNGSSAGGACGGGGGGGGGSGGVLCLYYKTLSDSGTIQSSGGSAGSGGTGQNGGATGSNGTAGAAGKIYKVKLL